MSIDLVSLFGPNTGYLAELYQLYKNDPSLVDPAWAEFFQQAGFNGAGPEASSHVGNGVAVEESVQTTTPAPTVSGVRARPARAEFEAHVALDAFRRWGHLRAQLSPLQVGGILPQPIPELSLSSYTNGKAPEDLSIAPRQCAGHTIESLTELVAALSDVYCGTVGFECDHITSAAERAWLRERIELSAPSARVRNDEDRKNIVRDLVKGELLESELHRKFVGAKRFSLEGNETLMPVLTALLDACAQGDVREVVFGMAHRGRLNVLINTMGKPLEQLFAEFEDSTAATIVGDGDVKYHLGHVGEFVGHGRNVRLQLIPNPSHLEAVNPVVEGFVRARQDSEFGRNRRSVLPVLMHGDAAVAGQGVVFECLNYAGLEGYSTGGTLHIVVNNQIGFTTTPDEGRSTRYCTDLAKGLDIPVFHVNAEDPESACWLAQLALEYRNTFGKDVIIDLIGHRKHGHNEGDDPTFTQPMTYAEVKEKKPLWRTYSDRLIAAGVLDEDFVQAEVASYKQHFAQAYERTKPVSEEEARRLHERPVAHPVDTRVDEENLRRLAAELVAFPDGFVPHPKLAKIIQKRVETVVAGKDIEWGVAESLAFGSLIERGVPIRLSGQDCRRGTFSHRHLVLDDFEKPQCWSPFGELAQRLRNGSSFDIHNSSLSEEGVVGFEFGYAAAEPKGLVMWEAQFGDFANGAQGIFDQFMASSETKWQQRSGLTLLLPHGYEGQGPEHSSARLERFLQLCAQDNMSVCYPSTAAQYFHLLRRQGLRDIKRPLVVMTPKSLLRFPGAMSTIEHLAEGSFSPLLVDGSPRKCKAMLLMSGKIYYDVIAALKEQGLDSSVCVARVEELYPLPAQDIAHLAASTGASRCFWIQEEPKNQGAWSYIAPQLGEVMGFPATYVGRSAMSSTATGSGKRHSFEQKAIVAELLGHLR
jgi:2-oxoglutarate dehydrogenase E1 component